ncbi:MAG TPA: hypothetical protein VK177_13245 [Flavobacteriales bacterium]|nr:hypothetical protein [Flavobacteriales bacterium]
MEDNYLIQELVEHKNFTELTNDERQMVLKEISQEEYESRRSILQSTRAFLQAGINKTQPSQDTKKRAAALMQVKKQEQKGIAGFIGYRIPAYAAVAAILILAFMLPLFYANEKPATKYVAMVDTVYREAEPKTVYDTVIKEKETVRYVNVPVVKYVEVKNNDSQSATNLAARIEVPTGGIVPTVVLAKEQLRDQLKNIGKSSSEQEELNKFLVSSQ